MQNIGQNIFKFSSEEALTRLKAGNQRFLSAQSQVPTLEAELLEAQADGQEPYATILGCSDSRVPPELIFDAWLGELFVIRVAGNVLDTHILGTLQYAARHLHTPLFVVMGHEGCGAVQAAIDYRLKGVAHPEAIEGLLEAIVPAVDSVDPLTPSAHFCNAAVEENVRRTMAYLAQTPEGQAQMEIGARIIGAVYELQTGTVRFLDDCTFNSSSF